MSARVLCFVEIDVDYCSLTYGNSPCTASIPTTGAIKCFNTLKTCQDRANFANAPVTLRFAMDSGYLPKDIPAIPNIRGVSFSPAIISLGQDLGQRAKVSVTFGDHPHSDTGAGFDKYLADRPYDPYKRGSFWAKFRARQPYLSGRPMRLIRGVLGQTLAEMETRHFLIESFDGPTPSGTYTLTAKDTLKLADGDRAQAPKPSNGFLAVGINNSVTSATLAPSGIGNAEYPASGFVNIGGKEVCSFTRSGDTLTLTRAQWNTEADAHAANERIQICLQYSAQTPAYIIHDLLTNYADIDPSYIDLSTWETEVASYYGRVCTGKIADPISVNDLVSELCVEAALALWWDDLAEKLRLKVIRVVPATAQVFSDENNILEGSLDWKEQPESRISTVQTFFGLRNPLEGKDDPSNYLSCALTVNDTAIDEYGINAIKVIYSRWIPFGGLAHAQRLNGLQLGRFRDPPRRFTFDVFRTGGILPAPGAGYQLEALALQDATGAQEQVPLQITSVNPAEDRYEVEAEEMRFDDAFLEDDDVNERRITIDVSARSINLRSLHDSLFPTPTTGDAATITVICTIAAGVIVGSTSATVPAFDIGSWPSGWDADNLKIVNRGRIQGKGGKGGKGGDATQNGANGEQGGTALKTTVGVDIDNSSGEIWGGGGGGPGGGGSGIGFGGRNGPGGGGGGGQGDEGGLGGAAGTGGNLTTAPQAGTPGTASAPGTRGAGANDTSSNNLDGGRGGHGGGPGTAGGTALGGVAGGNAGTPGAAGNAVDGDSYVTWTGTGSRVGPRIN